MTTKSGIETTTKDSRLDIVILDANVWISEHLLQSSLGVAALYSLTLRASKIVLPEVVKLEVDRILEVQAEQAVERIRTHIQLLKHVSGHPISLKVPPASEMKNGLKRRWNELSGLVEEVPFTHQHARSALIRTIEKRPPSGNNNEQFKDSCIWEVAREFSAKGTVHFVTSDNAFYQQRDHKRGLESSLVEELSDPKALLLYPNLGAYLSANEGAVRLVDSEQIRDSIVTALLFKIPETVESLARSIVEVGPVSDFVIKGYATPEQAVIAISFRAIFDAKMSNPSEDSPMPVELDLDGSCSYEPKSKKVSSLSIAETTLSLKGSGDSRTYSGGSISLGPGSWNRTYIKPRILD